MALTGVRIRGRGLGISLVAVLMLAACGGEGDTEVDDAANGAAPDEDEQASDGEGAEFEPTVIRISSEVGLDVDPNPTVLYWKELIEEASDGQVELQLLHSGQLFDDDAALDAVASGSLEGVTPTSSRVVGFSSDFQVLDLPFLFADGATFEGCVRGDLGAALDSSLSESSGMRALAFWAGGPLTLLNNEGELGGTDDWSGKRIRTFGGGVFEDTFVAAGVRPTQMPATEVPTAIQQGTIDSILTNWDGWAEVFIDLVDYGADPGAWYLSFPLVVNQDWWDGLSPDVQELISETLAEATDFDWPAHEERIEAAFETLAAADKTVYTLSESERQTWFDATAGVRAEFSDQISDSVTAAVDACTS